MTKLTQKQIDYLVLAPLLIICLIALAMYIFRPKAESEAIEFCPYIEEYTEEELQPVEPAGYEDLDVVEITEESSSVVERQPDTLKAAGSIPASPTMRSWVLSEVEKHGINPAEADCIIQAESSWNPKATGVNNNGSNDAGLWQINSIHGLSDIDRYDYKASTHWAINHYKKRGWQPWFGRLKCNIK